MDDQSRAFWTRYWSEFTPSASAETLTHVLDQMKLEYLQPLLPTRGLTLEVGCGSGRLSCSLALRGYRTVCLDFSLAALTATQRNYSIAGADGLFAAGDAWRLPFPQTTFDVVLSTGLLEHFPDPLPIVAEMVRTLKPGGLFYSDIVPKKFSLFRAFDWIRRLKTRRADSTDPAAEEFFERSFSAAEIRELLSRAGLPHPRVFPAGVIPPYIPFLYRSPRFRQAEVHLVHRTRVFWKAMDNTRLAEWLGFYYFAWATKP